MSLPIWTPAALASEAAALAGAFWRLVEAQHRVSTMKLVDSVEEQGLLEDLLEETKPTFPPDCAGLDYLLATPFRYGPYPHGSRFRRAGRTPGVFYAAAAVDTAVAEMIFYRLLFFAESPATPMPSDAAHYTGFSVAVETARAVDLTRPPFDAARSLWEDRQDYAACQALADAAREAGIGAILYASVRDPQRGKNLALLSPAGFARPAPVERQSWRIRLSPESVQALCEFPPRRLGFRPSDFAADPRLARFRQSSA